MVFCAFKVETLFHVKHLIKFISSSNHYTLETWPRGINATWITLSLLLDTYLQNTIFAILLAHEHLIWVALPLPPIQCCLQTVKAPIRKEFGQIVLSNIEWGKGGVWANDLWQWLSIHDNLRSRNYAVGSAMKEFEFSREKGGCYSMTGFFGWGLFK